MFSDLSGILIILATTNYIDMSVIQVSR